MERGGEMMDFMDVRSHLSVSGNASQPLIIIEKRIHIDKGFIEGNIDF